MEIVQNVKVAMIAHTLVSCRIWKIFPQICLDQNQENSQHLFPDPDCNLYDAWNIFYVAQCPNEGPLDPL